MPEWEGAGPGGWHRADHNHFGCWTHRELGRCEICSDAIEKWDRENTKIASDESMDEGLY